MRHYLVRAVATAIAFVPTAALAHTGIGGHSFVHGFAHPLGGLDHVLAMVTVGVFAWQLGGRALWLLPATFVLVMAAGGALGVGGATLPLVEFAIAASVIVLGAIVALRIRTPAAIAMGIVGLFAVFHGHAHGSDMPLAASAVGYGAGFMLATAMLHGLGLAAGFVIGRVAHDYGRMVYRVAGSAVALAGVAILTHVI
jgi:urease accessory protein